VNNPIIDSVVVDSAVTQVTVSGSGFQPSSSAPSVIFNGSTLTVISSSDIQFVASLPPGLVQGTYLPEVATHSDNFTDTTKFDVAIDIDIQVPPAPQFSSVSYVVPAATDIWGFAKNISLSTSPISIPLFGTNESSGILQSGSSIISGGHGVSEMSIRIYDRPPSGVSLSFSVKNLTTGAIAGPGTTQPDFFWGDFQVNPALLIGNGDQAVIMLSVSSGTFMLPFIQWAVG